VIPASQFENAFREQPAFPGAT